MKAATQPVIVIDRRPMIGRALCCWIGTLGPEFDPVPMATIDRELGQDILGRASAVIWGTSAEVPWEDEWLSNEITATRIRRHDVPLVLLADAADPLFAEEAVRELHLNGYIPTSSSPELAATALRLVICGGRYVPGRCSDTDAAPPAISPEPPTSAHVAKLTIREREVLKLLERGLPNKIIAYRLGMSQSTVKAHVHNVIAKLNVRNRTEAAVAGYAAPDRSERPSSGAQLPPMAAPLGSS
jgi:DNA-binding CsgD family transcriptional regulator